RQLPPRLLRAPPRPRRGDCGGPSRDLGALRVGPRTAPAPHLPALRGGRDLRRRARAAPHLPAAHREQRDRARPRIPPLLPGGPEAPTLSRAGWPGLGARPGLEAPPLLARIPGASSGNVRQ